MYQSLKLLLASNIFEYPTMADRSSRGRKRKHVNYAEDNDEEEEAQKEAQQYLEQLEAKDLHALNCVAKEAIAIEFDCLTGRPIRKSGNSPIDGLVKLSKKLLAQRDPNLFRDLKSIHSIIKQKVQMNDMVPWAGTDSDSTRFRSFGFMGKGALTRLDKKSAVRLHAPEKRGRKAILDERANRKAICFLHKTRECFDKVTKGLENERNDMRKNVVNPTLVADKLCSVILANQSFCTGYVDPNVLCSKELLAYQTNLHNGAKHLAAHLDAPLHEGFGKIIVTVAIHGNATILLFANGEQGEQLSWKFHLKEGEAYVLSGNVRNICLHAVLADGDGNRSDRESLNLRFGFHTVEEAEMSIRKHWPDAW